MLSNVKNIFKVEDLRNKLMFTFAMVAVYRFGAALRVPGIDAQAVSQLREASDSQGALGLRRIGHSNVLPDRPEIRGMLRRVPHLIEIKEGK